MGGSLYRRRRAYNDSGHRWDTACKKKGTLEEYQREGHRYGGLGEECVRVLVFHHDWVIM